VYDLVDDIVRCEQDVGVPASEDSIAALLKPARALFIVLRRRRLCVLAAIDLNAEFCGPTLEIDDVRTDRQLPREREPFAAQWAEAKPKPHFGVRHLASKPARELIGHACTLCVLPRVGEVVRAQRRSEGRPLSQFVSAH